jgi:DNA helicase-2/ATP-dependent DNA helicase PcrA
VPCPSAFQEADFVVGKIRDLLEEGVKPEAIAVLFRATHHSQTVEFELMKRGIPYDYRGGVKFFDRAHVKDALSFLRIKNNFNDEAAWLRILTLQPGVGEVMAAKMLTMFRAAGSLAHAVLSPVEATLGARAAKGWVELRPMLEKLVELQKPMDIVRAVTKSSYVDYLENEFPNWRERLEDIEQLAVFSEEYETASELLADIALDSGVVEKPANRGRRRHDAADKVVLSTIHQAKGLEWDAVFVVHLTNSGFPNRKAAMEEGGIEEERRLFYVAVTRSKKHLFLSYPATAGRDMFTLEQPSLFLEEANPKMLDLSLVEGRLGFAGSGNTHDDSDSGGFFEEDAVAVGDADSQDPFAEMKSKVTKIKRSFLRDV